MSFWSKLFGKGSGKKAQAMKGIDLLIEICTRDDLLDTSAMWDRAVDDLERAGEEGSRALASLLNEMLRCRSDGIGPAIAMAERLPPTQELIPALEAIQSATPVTLVVVGARFRPQIAGGGKIGWTDGEATSVKALATEALRNLRPPT